MIQQEKTPTSTGAVTGRPKKDRTGARVLRSSRTKVPHHTVVLDWLSVRTLCELGTDVCVCVSVCEPASESSRHSQNFKHKTNSCFHLATSSPTLLHLMFSECTASVCVSCVYARSALQRTNL